MKDLDVYDVNEARAIRRESKPDAWPFKVDGQTYFLPTELSRRTAARLRLLDDNNVDGLLRLLLGDRQYGRFDEHDLTLADIAGILEAYGSATGLYIPTEEES